MSSSAGSVGSGSVSSREPGTKASLGRADALPCLMPPLLSAPLPSRCTLVSLPPSLLQRRPDAGRGGAWPPPQPRGTFLIPGRPPGEPLPVSLWGAGCQLLPLPSPQALSYSGGGVGGRWEAWLSLALIASGMPSCQKSLLCPDSIVQGIHYFVTRELSF